MWARLAPLRAGRRPLRWLSTQTWDDAKSRAVAAFGEVDAVAGMATDRLITWLSRGMAAPLAVPNRFPGEGFGLMAARDIAEGEVVLTIPEAVWGPHSARSAIAVANSSAPALLEKVRGLEQSMAAGSDSRLEPLVALVFHLLFGGGGGGGGGGGDVSDGAYVDWLKVTCSPAAMAGFPVFWSEEQVAEIQNETTAMASQRLVHLAQAVHAAIFNDPATGEATPGAPPLMVIVW